MKRGLIIGSFDPVHVGHIQLIKYGLTICDQLNILLCATKSSDRISGSLRLQWLQNIFKNYSDLKIKLLFEEMPDSKIPSKDVSKIWAIKLKELYPNVNYIISSEKYGDYLADYMSTDSNLVKGIIFDLEREKVNISSTKIYNAPFKYWDYIPNEIKNYFVKKICIYGPECTGKSTLTEFLAKKFNTIHVPEVAKCLIDDMGINLDELKIEHLELFAKRQYEEVIKQENTANKLLFCDTDNITTQIYSKKFLNTVSENITKYEISYDLYLLLSADVPHISDKHRILGNEQQVMFDIFKNELEKRKINYKVIAGNDWEQRKQNAVEFINVFIQKYEIEAVNKVLN
jgi:HTH-type transcriptional repressor of NAD biosynthesis genes